MSTNKVKPTKSGSDKNITPDQLSAIDWAILKHVALYHLTIEQAVAETVFRRGSKTGGYRHTEAGRAGILEGPRALAALPIPLPTNGNKSAGEPNPPIDYPLSLGLCSPTTCLAASSQLPLG